ncbi:MAG TPA: glycoside hydrolase family 15 protein [Polyangiaceae bacterium]|nr:glycoside hydrolase family 15 protein [Polyangiaceae bacterium]
MSAPLEDYALIGDCHGAGLVSKAGSIDWLCVPRFDSPACFAALLGGPEHGRWLLSPCGEVRQVRRRYRGETLVLETEFETDEGVVCVIDCMPTHSAAVDVVRIVEGRRGRVRMQMELVIRFDYGNVVPWVTREAQGLTAIAGPEMLHLYTPVPFRGENLRTVAAFEVSAGERVPFVMTFHPSHCDEPEPVDAEVAVRETEQWWSQWSALSTYSGRYREAVQRSLIVLKALTYAPTGGIVAAPTTSLPEQLGGGRNWDYRYCWLRDATITLYSMLLAGYTSEARAWRAWLLRAVAGSPSQIQVMYGIAGERRLTESELPWLPGYEDSQPVRVGNGAYNQLQLDVFGELMDAMHRCRIAGIDDASGWTLERALLIHLEDHWDTPDEGIWEGRGPRRHFTHSKLMAWVAFDRGVKAVEHFGLEGPAERWRALAQRIHDEVCARAFSVKQNAFAQSYDSDELDAAVLLIPLVGFLPASDPRVQSTVAAIQRELVVDGLVQRYRTDPALDGLEGGEGAFLACSFWLVDNLVLLDRREEAQRLFERLLTLRNDLGLLAEEYDSRARRLVGNFPQAFSHLALVDAAQGLSEPKERLPEHRGAVGE